MATPINTSATTNIIIPTVLLTLPSSKSIFSTVAPEYEYIESKKSRTAKEFPKE